MLEFARNVLGLTDAHSTEFQQATPNPLVVFMPEGSKTHKVTHIHTCRHAHTHTHCRLVVAVCRSVYGSATGRYPVCVFVSLCVSHIQGGTMRLGARRTILQTVQCMSAKLYQRESFIDERHRHRCATQTHTYTHVHTHATHILLIAKMR